MGWQDVTRRSTGFLDEGGCGHEIDGREVRGLERQSNIQNVFVLAFKIFCRVVCFSVCLSLGTGSSMKNGQQQTIPWGANARLPLDMPPEWDIVGSMEPNERPPVSDPDAATREALAQPIGMQPLREVARSAKTVAIVVDDISRPTPVHLMMPGIVAELTAGGVPETAITVVTALGTHRPMTSEEIGQKIGPEWEKRLRWENHDYADPARNKRLGTTSRGTPVYVNATVASADLVLLVGLIEPHLIASFGGGYKNLIPGVAGAQTIAATHTLNLTRETFNMAGRPIESNPMRLDLEEGGKMLGKPVFIVNAILDTSIRIVRVVTGDPIAAHREGARTSAEMCGVAIPQMADLSLIHI